MNSELARSAYRQVEVNGSNRLQLVVMLYDGAIRFLGDAKACMEKKNGGGSRVGINRALAILGELQSTLKFEEGGEIAQSLDNLYTYMTTRILDSNLKGNTAGIEEAIKLLRTLNSAWTEIARKSEQPEAAPAVTSSSAPLELFG
jgi:flagellar protein FliS